jgi:hypothetical protein
MEPREVFIEEIPLHERPVGATVESPEEFWEQVESMDELYEVAMLLLDTFGKQGDKR